MIRKLFPRSIFAKLMYSYLAVVLIAFFSISLLFLYLVQQYFFGVGELEAYQQSNKVYNLLQEPIQEEDEVATITTAHTLAHSMEVEISVLNNDGETVVTALPEFDQEMGSFRSRIEFQSEEIEQVLDGNFLTKTTQETEGNYMQFSIPVHEEESLYRTLENSNGSDLDVVGLIFLNVPLETRGNVVANIFSLVIYSGLFAIAVASIFAYTLSNRISKPLLAINNSAKELARGNYRHRVQVETRDEIRQIANTFNYAASEIEKTVNEQKKLALLRRNLVAHVSHEFRTPLSSIRGYTELMRDGVIKDKDRDKYLNLILENTLHLDKLVNNLTTLSQIESGHTKIKKESVNPEEMAQWAYECITPEADKKGVWIDLSICKDAPSFLGDKDKMYQVLRNILENAVNYTSPNSSIWFYTYYREEEVVFEIGDSGPGIPEEEKGKIWERFYKGQYAGKESSGLGLAIAQQLVHLLDGRIELESKPGYGSVFRVIVPALK